ncbi:MAG TPA: 3D domain-containing protein [Tepidisphaeraceae bacterium]|jgi:3D (Asp-Asp-Asp) domain-containing protein|nr:3D domain-containing protein [Tepidisphaeraceae bacterium]
MANIRKPASVVRLANLPSFAMIAILGLAITLVATREAKTATVANAEAAKAPIASMIASPAPMVEQPKIELLHDITPTISTVVPKIVIPAMQKPAHRVIHMQVTAYCACPKCCGPDAIGLTASGKDVSYNNGKFVAADKQFAFGTSLVIPGYNDGKPVEVQDRGGAIKGNKLDVFFPTHQEALQWGRRNIDVTVIE